MINRNTVNVSCSQMRSYTPNGLIWTYDDLNIIEKNIALLYNELKLKRYDNIPKLSFTLGAYREF